MAYEIEQREEFSEWLLGLRDKVGKAKIARRLDRIRRGNFGDHKPVGDSVCELRFDGIGPGYRVYYVQRGENRIVLLCGGNKDRQERDIKRAKKLATEVV